MAPDLNAVAGGERFDYSQPGSSGYEVDQNVTWMDPNNRKLRVLTIGKLVEHICVSNDNRAHDSIEQVLIVSSGGGVTGIMMAYQIQVSI